MRSLAVTVLTLFIIYAARVPPPRCAMLPSRYRAKSADATCVDALQASEPQASRRGSPSPSTDTAVHCSLLWTGVGCLEISATGTR